MFAIVGWSALVAAVATVAGAIFLVLFFTRGEPWGTRNDLASIVMMLATVPVAVLMPDLQGDAPPGSTWLVGHVATAWAVGGVGVVGMLGAAVSQGLLVLRIRSYRDLLPWTLGAGAIVGAWYVLVGLLGLAGGYPPAGGFPPLLALLAIAAGVGYVAIGFGYWRGNERHPASVAGGLVLLVASTAFLTWVGIALTSDVGLLLARGPLA